MVEPTLNRIAGWASDGLVQGWDTSKLSMDNYIPGIADGGAGERATIDGKRIIVPSVWGTEAIIYSKRCADRIRQGQPRRPLGRQDMSARFACAPFLPFPPWAAGSIPRQAAEAVARGLRQRRRDAATLGHRACRSDQHKANIAQFWNGENDAQAAYRANGAVLGLNWDSTGYNLRDEGFGFIAPKEGAFAWNQGFVLMANAKNVEQAHQLARWVSTAEGSAAWASAFSANPVGKGGIELTSEDVKKFYASAYPGDALQKLWWWPAQEAWFTTRVSAAHRRIGAGVELLHLLAGEVDAALGDRIGREGRRPRAEPSAVDTHLANSCACSTFLALAMNTKPWFQANAPSFGAMKPKPSLRSCSRSNPS